MMKDKYSANQLHLEVDKERSFTGHRQARCVKANIGFTGEMIVDLADLVNLISSCTVTQQLHSIHTLPQAFLLHFGQQFVHRSELRPFDPVFHYRM